jgi:hypothetical protein
MRADDGRAPNSIEQLVNTDNFTGPLNEKHQQAHGARVEFARPD